MPKLITKHNPVYTIDDRVRDLRKAYINKDWEKVKELEEYLNHFYYGIKEN